MSIELQTLAREHSHPTMEAIVQAVCVIDQLGHLKIAEPADAKRKLQDAILGSGAEVEVASFLRKIERLDKTMGTSIANVICGWIDEKMSQSDWAKVHQDCWEQIQDYRDLVSKYLDIRQRQMNAQPEIDIGTTALLTARLWTLVYPKFLEMLNKSQNEGLHDVCHLKWTIARPYTLVEQFKRGTSHDVILTICELAEVEGRSNVYTTHLHPCVIARQGDETLKDRKEFSMDVFSGRRVAIREDSERVMPRFPWKEIKRTAAAIDLQPNTFSVDAYARCGCGLGLAHLELLSRHGQQTLSYLEINPKDFESEPVLALLVSDEIDARRRPYVDRLIRAVREQFDLMTNEYQRSKSLTEKLLSLKTSYHTRISSLRTKSRSSHGTTTEIECWKGTISLKVTPGLFVQGQLLLFPSTDSRHKGTELTEPWTCPRFACAQRSAYCDA